MNGSRTSLPRGLGRRVMTIALRKLVDGATADGPER